MTTRNQSRSLGDEAPVPCTEGESRARPGGRIFRLRALENYLYRTQEQVIPRLAPPRELAWLWLLVALLTAACLAAGFVLDSWTSRPSPLPRAKVSRALE